MSSRLVILWLGLVFSLVSISYAVEPKDERLVLIPGEEFQEVLHQFNREFVGGRSGLGGQAVALSFRLAPLCCSSQRNTVTVDLTSEIGNRALVEVVCDNALDDSVRGSRTTFLLVLDDQGLWNIQDYDVQWRCWPGRGDTTWTKTLCN